MFIHCHCCTDYLSIILLLLWLLMCNHSSKYFLVKYFWHVYPGERLLSHSVYYQIVFQSGCINCCIWEFIFPYLCQHLIWSVFFILVIWWIFIHLVAILNCIAFIITVFETVQNLYVFVSAFKYVVENLFIFFVAN